MQLLDMAGLDIYTAVGQLPEPGPLQLEQGLSTTIQELVDQGRLGMKTKGGIFDYTTSRSPSCARSASAASSRCARRSSS